MRHGLPRRLDNLWAVLIDGHEHDDNLFAKTRNLIRRPPLGSPYMVNSFVTIYVD